MIDPMSSVHQTYIALLLMPHNSLRQRLQPELAACRDAIALADDKDPEAVQDDYEAKVIKIRQQLGW